MVRLPTLPTLPTSAITRYGTQASTNNGAASRGCGRRRLGLVLQGGRSPWEHIVTITSPPENARAPWPPSPTISRPGTPGRVLSLVFCTPGDPTALRRWWSDRPPRTAYAGKSRPPSGSVGYGRDRRRDQRRSGRPPQGFRGFWLHVRLGMGERGGRAGRKTPVRQPWNPADHLLERRRASHADPRGDAPQPVDRPALPAPPLYLPR
jgi:hypothetical protein